MSDERLRDPKDHTFLSPNPDYCAICGMDREAHATPPAMHPCPTCGHVVRDTMTRRYVKAGSLPKKRTDDC